LVTAEWLEQHRLQAAEGYLLPGKDEVAGLAALFATRAIDHEVVDLLAAAAGSVGLGIERRRSVSALAQSTEASERDAVRIQQLESELARLERLTAVPAPVASQVYGVPRIGESHPGEFSRAVEEFSQWLEFALEQRSNKVEHGIADGLRALADRLTQMRVGPRDVIEIYSAALKRATDATTGRKDRAAVEEGRLLVLELMGNLMSNYRTLSFASPSGRGRHHHVDRLQEVERDG
jgi:hypothetical protein